MARSWIIDANCLTYEGQQWTCAAGLYHRYNIADYATLIGTLLTPVVGAAPIQTTAPGLVDFTLYGHPEGTILHAINGATAQNKPLIDCAPLAGFEVRVAVAAQRAILLETGAEIPLIQEPGGVRFTLPRLDNFAAIALLSERHD